MFRYLAVIWSEDDPRQCEALAQLTRAVASMLPSFTRVFAGCGLNVFFDEDADPAYRVYDAADGQGVVLGRLFHRDPEGGSAPGDARLDTFFSSALLLSDGQSLLRNYWGRYIALAQDPHTRATLVVPDPTGECPCYETQYRGITVLFNNASDVVALNLLSFSINWDYVTAQLFDPMQLPSETGLQEVSQLRAGEALRIEATAERRRMLCWDLFRIATEQPIDDFSVAAKQTHHVVHSCVSAWASCYPQIVHMLSGGLDSTIVLACLLHAASQPEITCLNVYDPTVGGDERIFARLAVNSIRSSTGRRGVLLERQRDVHTVHLEALSHITLSACPASYLPNAAYRDIHRQSAEPRLAALSTGLGGDYIFYRTSSARPAVDYIHDHGFGWELLRIVREHTGHRTYWSVLREAIVQGLFKHSTSEIAASRDTAFLNPEIVAMCLTKQAGDLPPWAASNHRTRVAPNKRRQIEALYRPVRKHDPFDDKAPLQWFAPLLSQPIMELFARIPVYVLKAGGIDRAVARVAFAGELPRALLERRSKGVTNNFIHAVFRRHQDYFRSILLDGLLARQGLLNRAQVETFFAARRDGFAEGFSSLLGTCLDLELWLQSWSQYRAANATGAQIASSPAI